MQPHTLLSNKTQINQHTKYFFFFALIDLCWSFTETLNHKRAMLFHQPALATPAYMCRASILQRRLLLASGKFSVSHSLPTCLKVNSQQHRFRSGYKAPKQRKNYTPPTIEETKKFLDDRKARKTQQRSNRRSISAQTDSKPQRQSKATFKPVNLQDSPLVQKFSEACHLTCVKILEQNVKDGMPDIMKQLTQSPPGSQERTQATEQLIPQMFSAMNSIVSKYLTPTEDLVKPTETRPVLKPLDVLQEFKKDFLDTSKLFSDYDTSLERFKAYVENPPLVPTLGRVHAMTETFDFNKENDIVQQIMNLLSKGYLRFYRARLRVSDLKISRKLNMTNPGEWYPKARAMSRTVYLHMGPTNSGKTYNALKALEAAESGYYAGPLRLLAREVYNRMKALNKKCNLITGEEVIYDYDDFGAQVKVSSGTIEMVDVIRPMDVAVIDEIQMIEDNSRGWAWTQAFLGVQAKEIHLCGDPSSEFAIRELCAITGDHLIIKRYERLSPLEVEKKPLLGNLENLEPGDCVIAFSKKDLLDWKREIEDKTQKRCAIIYGALPPESRSKQADEFNDKSNDVHYLVASDAVGMGLNLSIKRVIFLTASKFDGVAVRKISISQVKQIAGRAGRFRVPGSSEEGTGGKVTAMGSGDLRYIKECLAQETPRIRQCGLYPNDSLFVQYASSFGMKKRFSDVLLEMGVTSELNPRFYLCGVENMTEIAALFDAIHGLTLSERILLAKAPVKTRVPLCVSVFKRLCTVVANTNSITVLDIPEIDFSMLAVPADYKFTINDIGKYEDIHSNLVLYLWLSYRFPMNFRDRNGAMELKALCEEKINQALVSTRQTRLAKWRRGMSRDRNRNAHAETNGLGRPAGKAPGPRPVDPKVENAFENAF